MWYCVVIGCPYGYGRTIKPKNPIRFHVFPHPARETARFRQWLALIKNPKLFDIQPIAVFKSKRVCQRHFDSHCYNGSCRRLVSHALPTLHLAEVEERPVALVQPMDTVTVHGQLARLLQGEQKHQLKRQISPDADEEPTKRPRFSSLISIDLIPDGYADGQQAQSPSPEHEFGSEFPEEYLEEEYDEASLTNDSKLSSSAVCGTDFGMTSFSGLIQNELGDLNQVETLNEPPETLLNDSSVSEDRDRLPIEKRYEQLVREFAIDGTTEDEPFYFNDDAQPSSNVAKFRSSSRSMESDSRKFCRAPLNEEFFQKCRTEFYDCPKNVLAQNVCTRIDPFDACLSRKTLENTQHVFTYKIENEGKPLTNQKSSGRCWLFAALNCIRIPFIKQYNLDEFEFSQAYLFYWDKIERANYFLNNVVETAKRGEAVDGRLVSFLLSDPTCDGGQWDMLVNLINKHGVMPKKCFPESYSCEASTRMNSVIKSKLREYAKDLRQLVGDGATDEEITEKIRQQMNEIYNVVGICLGIPPEKFTWECYDKSKKYLTIGPIRPIDFYEKYVKPYFNVDDKVCLVTDPRSSNLYGRSYTVDCLGNVVGGRPVLYNNQPVELLLDLVTKALKFGEPVWFGCEVNKRFAGKQGIEDLNIHDFKLVFGVDIQTTMDKADRLLYGESMMTHAMVFTGVSVDPNSQKPTKFRVENSWGEDRGEKGYLIMSADWFKEFVFEVVVDRSIVSQDVLDVFDLPPIVLPAWDPMGTLAK
ncbi:bleomycin hydrolase isoform X1 [Anopheles aquasalis]|uniref:bleomycin hydrolase isoform X1 n=1 Tax=Anopheles aquasalis TaxID=42839 RepID=UPI00215A3484|nr:bleomycin hydrolase isoform X1 [Anopheles aquasalis]